MTQRKKMNALYAQSGGVTAVINATASGLIQRARERKDQIGKVYAGQNGILGILNENIIDTSKDPLSAIQKLAHTPGGGFGSCRYKLKSLDENKAEYERLIQVFKAHNIGYFFYNGGGDSQDTAHKVSQIGDALGYPITCIGIPKTVDNDLAFTDNCPGFGSVAKYVALSTKEAALDVASMASTSTKVFIFEVMGRHTGWIAASGGMANPAGGAPHIILFPEVAFDQAKFLQRVEKTVKKVGYCVIVVSEGIRDAAGKFVADAGLKDAFGHTQLGGVAPVIANLVKSELGLKNHWAVADYLQRSARHIASQTDLDQAFALGQHAIDYAIKGHHGVMLTIERKPTKRYSWTIGHAPLHAVANVEKTVPKGFITRDGFGITDACREYLEPLIRGEAYPPYTHTGMPDYVTLKNILVKKKLPKF